MSAQEPMSGDVNLPSCTSAFDALWFCYSPVNQVSTPLQRLLAPLGDPLLTHSVLWV